METQYILLTYAYHDLIRYADTGIYYLKIGAVVWLIGCCKNRG
jgi:hypothetical protein